MSHLLKYFNLAIQNYANFRTRTTRKQFWMFQLTFFCFWIVLSCISSLLGYAYQHYIFSGLSVPASLGIITLVYHVLVAVFYLFLIIPMIAIQARRLHDTNKSGWLILLSLVPVVGTIVLIVFYCLAGDKGPNHYGPPSEA